MFSVVLFDLDGTLIPSLQYWLRAYQAGLRHFGVDFSEDETVTRCFYRAYHEIATELALPCAQQFGAAIERQLALEYAGVELYTGVRDTLEELSAQGVHMGLVTSSPRTIAQGVLERLQLRQYFPCVVSGCDVKKLKPDPEPILQALQQFGRVPEQVLMVGDYVVDVEAGRAAGTATALHLPNAHKRFYDLERLRSSQPDFVFEEYSQLTEFVTGSASRTGSPSFRSVA